MRPWLHLARISNLPTIWTNVTAAWLLAGGELADARLYWLILAGSLLYTGGMILNDAADVKFDREHRKERPIPSGQVSVRAAWIVSVVMLLAGSTLAAVFGANPRITVFLVSAVVIYDLYHKQWSGSVIIMGACRTLLYLMAASAALEPALPAAIALGCYVVGITVAARLEHKSGSLPPAALLLALVLLYTPGIVFAQRFASTGGHPMQIVILAAFAILIALATQTLRKGGPASGQAVGMLLAGIVIVDALAVSSVSVTVALGFVALAPLLRLWQRWVAAT
ncbi:MAG: UbiA family prenyltransferase [Verrucomicrobiaceae bacterium]|nr:UbiA family prenyltransferase [Verrucomicrobiaceae bacterium]